MSRKNFSHKKLKLTFFCTRLQKHLKIYPKGLDSSNNIDNRMKITSFFNLPDMFRRYLRHLQCYIFWNRCCNKVRYIALAILRAKKFTELVTFSYLQGESQVYVFHLLVEGGFLPFYSGAPARAKRAWDRAPYPWNMVNLFSFGCHVIDRAYVLTRLQIVWMG